MKTAQECILELLSSGEEMSGNQLVVGVRSQQTHKAQTIRAVITRLVENGTIVKSVSFSRHPTYRLNDKARGFGISARMRLLGDCLKSVGGDA